MNILLVEDDYLLGRSTAKLLEKLGDHRVRLTHKAADVFKHCQSGAIDLVIMDVNLPGTFWQGEEVSGVDLSRLLKTHAKTAHLPVVLLTAHSMNADQARLVRNAHADCLCTKPIEDYEAFLALLMQMQSGGGAHGLTMSAS
ncbi:MAG: CheY-like receiver [Phormidesmis priestleyi Ana]|uniref:CheY-like receiver n=1 Tax=Phormidesmis priestleyi Ana TaxID=1666911 RepID=A0A0P7ZMS6_9CYAN|nr:MAG: CheY-like receiver [Phormidesmis priestleyi Ana]